MILAKGNVKLHTEDQCLYSASRENCFDLRHNIAEDGTANISSHAQQGQCCVLSVQRRATMGSSSINTRLSLILDKVVAGLEVPI